MYSCQNATLLEITCHGSNESLAFRLDVRLAPVLKHFFINVSYHILVASLPLMALF